MLDPARPEAEKTPHCAHHPRPFRKPIERLVCAPVDEPKIACILRDRRIAEFVYDPVKPRCRKPAEAALVGTATDDAVDVLVTRLPPFDEARDQLRRFLEIGRHDDRRVTAGVSEAGRHPAFHEPISRKLDDLPARIERAHREQLRICIVDTPVLDCDHFELIAIGEQRENSAQPFEKRCNVRALVIERRDDRDKAFHTSASTGVR